MSYQQLLAWIQVAQLDECKAADILPLVEDALEELAEDDPVYETLLDIEDDLIDGEVPVDLLAGLVCDLPPRAGEPIDEVESLEACYRSLAAGYAPEQWRMRFYVELETHLADSEDEDLLDFVDELRERITKTWEKYSADYASIQTTSAETVVGHRLMKDGYEAWMRALDLVEADGDDAEVLEEAEAAIRLLVAVGQLDRDVKMQAGSLTATFQTNY